MSVVASESETSSTMSPAPSGQTLPKLTVGIVTFNSEKVVDATIRAVLECGYDNLELLVVDNGSTDRTCAIANDHEPAVRVIRMPDNRGPNPARNRIVEEAGSGLAVILDDDCMPTPGSLQLLVLEAMARPDGAAFGGRYVYFREPERIQFDGARIHYLGDAIQIHNDCLISTVPDETMRVTALGGGCMLIRVERWREVGGFDETYFFGREDGEFVHRLLLAGYALYVVPRAIIAHDFEPRGFKAGFYQIRNRWLTILGLYRIRTLILLAPVLALHEFVIAGFMTLSGNLGLYLRATGAVFGQIPAILARRRAVRAFRRVPDREVLAAGKMAIRDDILGKGWKKHFKTALDGFYSAYWSLVRRFV